MGPTPASGPRRLLRRVSPRLMGRQRRDRLESVRVALIPGDGVGKEVVPEAVRVLDAVCSSGGALSFEYSDLDWGCDLYRATGQMMPEDGLDRLASFDAILLGAIGAPDIPDHLSLWGLLIPIRRHFQQYINLRPIRLLPGVVSPLRGREAGSIDMVVVRENSEGEYSVMGGRIHEGTPSEVAIQVDYFSRIGTERVMRYAFELARGRSRRLTVCTKSNGIVHTMPFWDQVAREISTEYPDVEVEFALVDALAARFITHPDTLDVVVGSNLHADILTDIGGAIMGSIGLAPAANLNPERALPSMFEPVHGSAPDIAGKQIANPIGEIWTAAMMLDFLGSKADASRVVDAIEATLRSGVATPDIGGSDSTSDVTNAVINNLTEARS
jgi:tartrate dehydrogenase/decarboxylase / D-malate dehydrogenase